MKNSIVFCVVALAGVLLLWSPKARTAANDEAEIRQLQDQWTKAFRMKDINGIMSVYETGNNLIAYDIVPPLQYAGFDAYKKDYEDFLDQFQSALDVEMRNVSIIAGDTVAFSRGLERISGTLKGGEKFDSWIRFTQCYRKTHGRWLAVHDHISVPVDFASGKALLDLKP